MEIALISSNSTLPPIGTALSTLAEEGKRNDSNFVYCILQELETLHFKEQQLLILLKQTHTTETGEEKKKSNHDLPTVAKFVQDYRETLKSKENLLSSLLDHPLERVDPHFDQHVLTIVTQPNEILIANRYVLPGPIVVSSFRPNQNSLIIRADLLYNTSKTLIASKNGKKGVLEGVLEVSPDRNGQAIFSKLKLKEVSSKHEHQSFVFSFTLEEYTPHGGKRVVDVIYSSSFHVQSYKRPSKKRKHSPDKDQNQAQRPKLTKGASNAQDKYVDITSLLVLPQKDAAQSLGISESMLCKRFKECTQRKWPYRYLQKIDKVIHILQLRRKEGSFKEDDGKLERLIEEREEILAAVTIRITSHDRQDTSLESEESAEDGDGDSRDGDSRDGDADADGDSRDGEGEGDEGEGDSLDDLNDQDLQNIVESLHMLQKSQVVLKCN